MKYSPGIIKLQEQFTPTQIQEMLDTKSLYQVYTSLKISDKLLLKYIKQYGLSYTKAFRTNKDLTEKEKNDILNDWTNSHITKREIFKKYNIGPKTLNRFLRDNQVSDRNKSQVNTNLIQYQKLVRRLTSVVLRHYKLISQPGYEWDHKFSVIEGFKQNIHPSIIASRENLELIPAAENRSNGRECSITRDELFKLILVKS